VAADQVDAKTAGYTSSGAGITSHSLVSLPSLKRGDASVVGSHCVAEELRQRWTKLPSRRPVVSGLRFRGPNLGPYRIRQPSSCRAPSPCVLQTLLPSALRMEWTYGIP